MPVPAIKNLAKEAGISLEKAEKYWKSAKRYVENELDLTEKDGEEYYKRVMGAFKQYIRGKLNEDTTTGDFPVIDAPLREPDEKGPYGHPSFTYDKDDIEVSKILDGRGKYSRWEKHIPDTGIVNWARKNPFKSFYLKVKNIHVKVR